MYTFDRFVVSEHSHAAYSSCLAVARNPGRVHNPLLLYGTHGAGKTHLLYAIEHEMRSRRDDAKVLRLTIEKFVDRMITAIRSDTMSSFLTTLLESDALLLDDLCCVAGRRLTTEEIFRNLEAACRAGVQVVMACSGSHAELRLLKARIENVPNALSVHVGKKPRSLRARIVSP